MAVHPAFILPLTEVSVVMAMGLGCCFSYWKTGVLNDSTPLCFFSFLIMLNILPSFSENSVVVSTLNSLGLAFRWRVRAADTPWKNVQYIHLRTTFAYGFIWVGFVHLDLFFLLGKDILTLECSF